jgi:hypothetical protein
MAGSYSGRLQGAGTPFDWPEAIGFGRQPFASFPAGADACVAGSQGVALGIFGWIDPVTFQVANARSSGAILGFVLPVFNMYNWQRSFPQRSPPPVGRQLILRAGLECIVALAGDFVTTFPLGALVGSRVWTDPATGVPYGEDHGGYVATRWTVMQNGCGCNARLRISSFVKPLH